MRERWNHPCVVIWDAQNESFTEESGKAIRAVRGLDRSGRPWENGWSEPQAATDCVESHPYLFIRGWQGGKPFRLSELVGTPGRPALNDRQRTLRVPILINEYCWLWLNRDGSPTCLTGKVYEGILGKDSTVAQRRLVHARYVAALTEFWRGHRQCAGVLHFCGLGYSRRGDLPRPEGGATSDDWIDLEALRFEPTFERFVRDAFSPVGVMLDFWDERVRPGEARRFKVVVINDLDRAWNGEVRVTAARRDREEGPASPLVAVRVPAWGREVVEVPLVLPAAEGDYTLAAELTPPGEQPVRSLRDFKVDGLPPSHR
jgi:beta-galactosidase